MINAVSKMNLSKKMVGGREVYLNLDNVFKCTVVVFYVTPQKITLLWLGSYFKLNSFCVSFISHLFFN